MSRNHTTNHINWLVWEQTGLYQLMTLVLHSLPLFTENTNMGLSFEKQQEQELGFGGFLIPAFCSSWTTTTSLKFMKFCCDSSVCKITFWNQKSPQLCHLLTFTSQFVLIPNRDWRIGNFCSQGQNSFSHLWIAGNWLDSTSFSASEKEKKGTILITYKSCAEQHDTWINKSHMRGVLYYEGKLGGGSKKDVWILPYV